MAQYNSLWPIALRARRDLPEMWDFGLWLGSELKLERPD